MSKTVEEYEKMLLKEISKIPGGYVYEGVCSTQYCFYLRDGGELRFSCCECDNEDGSPSDMRYHFDHYDGMLPPGITGFVVKTGE